MKQLILLLLIISITIISWSSCAKSTKIQVNAIYYQSSSATNSLILTPILFHKYSDEDFTVTANQSTNKTNNFFELAIIFNEKLQQFIAFFADLSDEIKALTHHDFLSENSSTANKGQSAVQKCNVNS